MITITLHWENAKGDWFSAKAQTVWVKGDMGPRVITTKIGRANMMFSRHGYSSDYYTTTPIKVIVLKTAIKKDWP